jgi:hypothetical protein
MPLTAADKTRASMGGCWATSEQIVKMTLGAWGGRKGNAVFMHGVTIGRDLDLVFRVTS